MPLLSLSIVISESTPKQRTVLCELGRQIHASLCRFVPLMKLMNVGWSSPFSYVAFNCTFLLFRFTGTTTTTRFLPRQGLSITS